MGVWNGIKSGCICDNGKVYANENRLECAAKTHDGASCSYVSEVDDI